MTASPTNENDVARVLEEAGKWKTLVDSAEMSEKQRLEFHAWLGEPHNRRALTEVQVLLTLIQALPENKAAPLRKQRVPLRSIELDRHEILTRPLTAITVAAAAVSVGSGAFGLSATVATFAEDWFWSGSSPVNRDALRGGVCSVLWGRPRRIGMGGAVFSTDTERMTFGQIPVLCAFFGEVRGIHIGSLANVATCSCIPLMISTGIRELKNKLSHYVRQIEAGKRVAVTAHGRVVAELVPPGAGTGERARTRNSWLPALSCPQSTTLRVPQSGRISVFRAVRLPS